MRYIRIVISLMLGCSFVINAQPLVSMSEILSNQEQYNEKPIHIYGIASFKFEKTQIKTKDGSVRLSLYEQPYTEESIKKDEERIEKWSAYEGKCVLLGGIFHKGGKHGGGHLGGGPAEIAQIWTIVGVDAINCE